MNNCDDATTKADKRGSSVSFGAKCSPEVNGLVRDSTTTMIEDCVTLTVTYRLNFFWIIHRAAFYRRPTKVIIYAKWALPVPSAINSFIMRARSNGIMAQWPTLPPAERFQSDTWCGRWLEHWAQSVKARGPERVAFEASWNIQIGSGEILRLPRKPQQAKRNEIRTFVNKKREDARRMEKFFN